MFDGTGYSVVSSDPFDRRVLDPGATRVYSESNHYATNYPFFESPN